MKNKELIEHLQTLNPDLPVLVRIEDPCGGPDYWELTTSDIAITDVDENERLLMSIDDNLRVLVGRR